MKDVNLLKNNGVNLEKSLEIFGDMEMYDETLVTFLGEVVEKLSKIKEYKEVADMANYAILVHSLKNDVKYFGFDKLADLSFEHEKASKDNDIYYVTENYDDLMSEANRIVSVVKQYLGETPVSEIPEEETRTINLNKKILVVDESNVIKNYIHSIFGNTYNLLEANDGAEAINVLSDPANDISVVLLDLNMPNVDGFAVLDYAQANNLFELIPIVIITGEDAKEVIERASSYPVVDILKKPFNEKTVKDTISRIMD